MTDGYRIRAEPDWAARFRLSQAFRVGDLVIISGRAAIGEDGTLVGDFDAQAERTFHNVRAILEAGGSALDRIVKMTIYLTDINDRPRLAPLLRRLFRSPYPASTVVGVTALGIPGATIEVEAIGLVRGRLVDAAPRRPQGARRKR
ncbi:MAG: RidA family protein [Alphaproteobacteria bacterium]|nr:RidA family protein [Alphaproteobacteria bacterium]